MKENLKTTRYRNGAVIPNVTEEAAWRAVSSDAWCNYVNSATNDTLYGKMYNWYTVSDARGLCPTGWHIPSDAEWTALSDYLGGETIAGDKMKATSGWQTPDNGNNESGFTALPGGIRGSNGAFAYRRSFGGWWSSSESNEEKTWYRQLAFGNSKLLRFDENKKFGFSVRCAKD